MIQILDGTAQKFAELVITNDQLILLEKKQQENYSADRMRIIKERRKKIEDLTAFLYDSAVNIQHELIKEYPTHKMVAIGGLIHG